jgi:hypothetical protein
MNDKKEAPKEYHGPDELAIGNLMATRYNAIGSTIFWGAMLGTVAETLNRNKDFVSALGEFAEKGAVTGVKIWREVKDANLNENQIQMVAKNIGEHTVNAYQKVVGDLHLVGPSNTAKIILGVAAAVSVIAPVIGYSVGQNQAREARENFYSMKEEKTSLQAEISQLKNTTHEGIIEIKDKQKTM